MLDAIPSRFAAIGARDGKEIGPLFYSYYIEREKESLAKEFVRSEQIPSRNSSFDFSRVVFKKFREIIPVRRAKVLISSRGCSFRRERSTSPRCISIRGAEISRSWNSRLAEDSNSRHPP